MYIHTGQYSPLLCGQGLGLITRRLEVPCKQKCEWPDLKKDSWALSFRPCPEKYTQTADSTISQLEPWHERYAFTSIRISDNALVG